MASIHRQFISLKAVLLHNGNNYPSLPMAHSVHLKEDYTSVKMLLGALKYDDYGWEVISDFKIVLISFLMGLQGFTKFPLFPVSGTAVTLRRIIAQRTGHNGPSILLGRAM